MSGRLKKLRNTGRKIVTVTIFRRQRNGENEKMLDESIKKAILEFQRNEITEYYIYRTLARFAKTEHNRNVMKQLADEEMRHYHIWHKYTGEKIKPKRVKRWFYVAISAILGVTFGIKLMETGESNAFRK